MKKELGDCTRRLSLCFLFSSSAGGFSKSISFWSTYFTRPKRNEPKVSTNSNVEIKLNTQAKSSQLRLKATAVRQHSISTYARSSTKHKQKTTEHETLLASTHDLEKSETHAARL
ncbi:hypothetical protein EUGRSUZ_I01578 [Eucalyptus grandis]|uniref:Uncharacterized protein n=2 Tax=Eucalyptus grandis TaxID=71139 RepID=A0ACC3JGU9_EUCGR|nr:hypothetical protein EUGRSUZ_I01578 [Eucalyptus grandis]